MQILILLCLISIAALACFHFAALLMNNLGFGSGFIEFSLQEPFEKLPKITQDKQNKADLFTVVDTAMFGIMAGLSIVCQGYYN